MRLDLSPMKLLRMAWPIYALIALGALLHPRAWLVLTPATLAFAASPLLILAAGLALREHWWLELTNDALVHHRFRGADRFAWSRMGPVEIPAQHILHLPLVRTLWFPFPTDEPHGAGEQITKRIGRRLLLVFGDRSSVETMRLIEAWRRGERLS